MEIVPQDYRTILKEEFAARCKRNGSYSMRAFARDINLSPSRLSEVMSGKHGLSRASAQRVSAGLGYGQDEQSYFCDLVESVHGRSESRKKIASLRLQKHQADPQLAQLKIDTFKLIADWYHLAIVELTKLDEFQSDYSWIADSLGISETEVELAVERLLRLGLLEKDQSILKGGSHSTPSGIPSKAIKSAHRQILDKAKDALEFQTPKERVFSSSFVAISKDSFDRIQEQLNQVRLDIYKESRKSSSKDELYCLGMQFFKL